MERLLRYTAKHGPRALSALPTKAHRNPGRRRKSRCAMSPYFSGEKTLPGQFFDDAHQTPREAAMAAALVSELATHFPRDLLDPQPGPALDADRRTQSHRPHHPDHATTPNSPARFPAANRAWRSSGIGVLTRISFDIPGDSEPLVFKLTVWRAPDLRTITDASTAAELYEAMAGEAFKRLTKKYLATLFVEH